MGSKNLEIVLILKNTPIQWNTAAIVAFKIRSTASYNRSEARAVRKIRTPDENDWAYLRIQLHIRPRLLQQNNLVTNEL